MKTDIIRNIIGKDFQINLDAICIGVSLEPLSLRLLMKSFTLQHWKPANKFSCLLDSLALPAPSHPHGTLIIFKNKQTSGQYINFFSWPLVP